MSATIWVDPRTNSVFLASKADGDPPMAKGWISIEGAWWNACSGLFAEQTALVSYLQESCLEVNQGDKEYQQYLDCFIARCDKVIGLLHDDIAFAERLKNEFREISGTQPEEPK